MQPTIDKIRELIDGVMVDEFEVDRELLRPDALLVKDLDLDSLDGVDLVVALEKTFGCRIPEERAKEIRTLGDVYDSISELLQAAA